MVESFHNSILQRINEYEDDEKMYAMELVMVMMTTTNTNNTITRAVVMIVGFIPIYMGVN